MFHDSAMPRQGADTFEALLEAAPDAMVIVDERGKIIYVNAQTEVLFGYARAELLGTTVDRLVPERFAKHHSSHRQSYANAPRVRPMGAGLQLFARRKDASEFPVEISLSPIYTEHEMLVCSVIRDVTERASFERALREKNEQLEEANLAKDNFLAGMSHELRTPLNAIIGFTGTLLMRLPGPLTSDQERQLTIVQSSARHLLSLINDLLDIAKIRSGKVELQLEPVLLNEALAEVAQSMTPLAAEKSLRLYVTMPDDSIVVRADARAVRQILTNLASNAVKYTSEGEVELHLAASDGQAVITVRDTGMGIREEDLHKLFQPFSQVDQSDRRGHEGAGLGLYLSSQLATLVGGEIHVHSHHAQGSTFALRLPLARS